MVSVSSSDIADKVLIIGGGMAGSLLALVLGRRGLRVDIVDPRADPAPVFRNEKLGEQQIELLRELGALSCFEEACWPQGAYRDAPRPGLNDCGAPHQAWLRSVRAAWPDTVRFVQGTAAAIDADSERPQVSLSSGETLEGRLVVLASGRMQDLHEQIGVTLRVISRGHSTCLGFSVEPEAPVAAQIHFPPFGGGVGYLTIFPMPEETRVNIFSYRRLDDAWVRAMARDPLGALNEIAPDAIAALGKAKVMRRCEARGTDLYVAESHRRAGVVLLGDAFHAPCPASGTGMLRILNDIKVLTRNHIFEWLQTPGMGADKIARYYDDAAKASLDADSLRNSLRGREWALNTSARWRAMRLLKRARADAIDHLGRLTAQAS